MIIDESIIIMTMGTIVMDVRHNRMIMTYVFLMR